MSIALFALAECLIARDAACPTGKIALSATDNLVNLLLRTQDEGGGWGRIPGSQPNPADSAYAFAGLAAISRIHGQQIPDVLSKAADYIVKSDLDLMSFERRLDADVPPFRHFAVAWALIGFSYYNFHPLYTTALSTRLLDRVHDGGWSVFSVEGPDAPLTWTTALAMAAIVAVFDSTTLRAVLHIAPWTRQGVLQRVRITSKLFSAQHPFASLALILLTPPALFTALYLPLAVAFSHQSTSNILSWCLAIDFGISTLMGTAVAFHGVLRKR